MEQSSLEESANKLVDAWESLPEGFHSPKEIGEWLAKTMKPAIDDLRNFLGRSK
jgi:hypothetical protein